MKPYLDQDCIRIIHGDCRAVLRELPDESVNCCVTSPPYWGLRDYGHPTQLGLEETPEKYVAQMVEVFRQVRRVLKDDGTLWLNLGDSYCANKNGNKDTLSASMTTRADGTRKRDVVACGRIGGSAIAGQENADISNAPHRGKIDGMKPKDLVGIPWSVAFALRADGWYLRQDIIWHKPNPMPESVTDRCTKAHEYIFLLSKSATYYYDAEAIAEPASCAGRIIEYDGSQKNCSAGDDVNDRRTLIDRTVEVGDSRNRRSVWTVTTKPYSGAHFATFPPDLIDPCIKAGCPVGGTVLDPFFGAGTTGVVCQRQGVACIGIELNESYCKLAADRFAQRVMQFPAPAGAQGPQVTT